MSCEQVWRGAGQVIFEELERQNLSGATISLQGGWVWIDGEAAIDPIALANAILEAAKWGT